MKMPGPGTWSCAGVLALVALCGAASAAPNSTAPVSIQGYRRWTRANPRPFKIPPANAAGCATWFMASPHSDRYITVYVNALGRRTMLSREARHFPVGSILVKEKLRKATDTTPELMTVMVKRPAGFDPAHGDWEYSVRDADGRPTDAGRVQHCQSCHEGRKLSDYVFGDYLPASAARPRRASRVAPASKKRV
jgi:hypothetical protein